MAANASLPPSPEPETSTFLHAATPEEFLPPISRWTILGGLIFFAIFGAAVALTAILKYKVTVKAPATLRPAGELRIVQAATEGIVKSLQVKENQTIQQGEVIAYLDDSRLKTKKSQLTNNIQQAKQQLAQIDAQVIALDRQIAAQTGEINGAVAAARAELSRSQRNYQDKQITSRAEVEEAKANLRIAQKEWQEAQKELKSAQANLRSTEAAFKAAKAKRNRYQKAASDGVLSQDQLEETQLAFEQQQQAVQAQQATVEKQQEAIQRRQEAVQASRARVQRFQTELNPSQAEVEIATEKITRERATGEAILASLSKEREELIQQRVEIAKQLSSDSQELQQTKTDLKETIIRAPISGIIQELTLRNRSQVVRSGDKIAQIAPTNTPLEIKALVASGDIGKVKVGQTVQMRVGACPYPDYGTLKGTVRAISPDTMLTQNQETNETSRKTPEASATYTATIQPDSLILSSGKEQCPIQVGMDGRADIISQEETVLQFILRKARLLAG